MNTQCRLFRAAAAAAFLMMFLGVEMATAQMPWSPLCPNVTILNTSNCPAQIRLRTTPMGVLPAVVAVPAGGMVVLPVPVALFTIDGITSPGGFFYPFLPPPPVAPCNCLPGDWSICCVRLLPTSCCFDICGTNTNPPCRITIRPAACNWPTCRP